MTTRIYPRKSEVPKRPTEKAPKGGEIVLNAHVVELHGSVAERSARFEEVPNRKALAEFAIASAQADSGDAEINAGVARIVRGEAAFAITKDGPGSQ